MSQPIDHVQRAREVLKEVRQSSIEMDDTGDVTIFSVREAPIIRLIAQALADAAAQEREACAQIASDGQYDWCEDLEGTEHPCFNATAIASAIRQRGEGMP